MQRAIDEVALQLETLRKQLDDPESEYARAQAEFTALDKQVAARKKQIEDGDAAEALGRELEDLQSKRTLAKDRFDLAIQERRTLQEQIATLERRQRQDRAALAELTGESRTAVSQHSDAAEPERQPAFKREPATAGTDPKLPPAPLAAPAIPPAEADPASTQGETPQSPPAAAESPEAKPPEELVRAREAATEKQSAAAQAERQVQSLRERMEALSKSIELERSLFDTARQRSRNARDTERALYDQLQRKWREGAEHQDLAELQAKIAEARQRLQEAERETRERTDRVDELQGELAELQSEHIKALEAAEQKQREAQTAQRRVQWLESPLAPANIWRWIVQRGPHVLVVIVAMAILLRLARFAERRFLKRLRARTDHGGFEDRDNRARTLMSVFHSAVCVVIYVGGILMILTEVGMNIVPLMGGAAVAGLAVAFGAQNLIRDYFYGFTILLENQYVLNDVVKIGDTAGLVERITLRLTVLRGLDGTVHFIPNGQIATVSNLTHGWSRVVLDVPIAYREDVDRVMEVLMELGRELRRDPEFRGLILEMPEMLGVEEFADSAVVIRLLLKTRPLKQWAVKREMLRRVKKRFDELCIEIPFPHRTVYHRYEDGPPLFADGTRSEHKP